MWYIFQTKEIIIQIKNKYKMKVNFFTGQTPDYVFDLTGWTGNVNEFKCKKFLQNHPTLKGKPLGNPSDIEQGGLYYTRAVGDVFAWMVKKDGTLWAAVYSWQNGELYLFQVLEESKYQQPLEDTYSSFCEEVDDEEERLFWNRIRKQEKERKKSRACEKLYFEYVGMGGLTIVGPRIRDEKRYWDGYVPSQKNN